MMLFSFITYFHPEKKSTSVGYSMKKKNEIPNLKANHISWISCWKVRDELLSRSFDDVHTWIDNA